MMAGMGAAAAPYNTVRKGLMNNDANQDELARELWRRMEASADGALPPVDANLLAAYLDGTASPAEVEHIEGRMAADPALLEEVIELRELAGAEADVAGWALLARAKALVPAGADETPPARTPTWRGVRGWWRSLQWTAAAAAVVVACWGGYSFGQTAFLTQRQTQAVEMRASGLLGEVTSEPDLDFPPRANGGNEDGS